MPTFRIINIEAVWERASWTVEADDIDDALEVFKKGESETIKLEWKEITGNVEALDQEIESLVALDDEDDVGSDPDDVTKEG